MEQLRKTLRSALTTHFGIRSALDDDTGLFSGGLIDSLSIIDLVTFVEVEAGLAIPPTAITLENFDSINRIVKFVEQTQPAEGKG